MSEDQFKGELNRSRRRPCSRHLTESSTGRSGIGNKELRMVQSVEPVRADLNLVPLPVDCSGQHGVQIVLPVLADSGEEAAQNPQVITELDD